MFVFSSATEKSCADHSIGTTFFEATPPSCPTVPVIPKTRPLRLCLLPQMQGSSRRAHPEEVTVQQNTTSCSGSKRNLEVPPNIRVRKHFSIYGNKPTGACSKFPKYIARKFRQVRFIVPDLGRRATTALFFCQHLRQMIRFSVVSGCWDIGSYPYGV